jgi:hypothetical protein
MGGSAGIVLRAFGWLATSLILELGGAAVFAQGGTGLKVFGVVTGLLGAGVAFVGAGRTSGSLAPAVPMLVAGVLVATFGGPALANDHSKATRPLNLALAAVLALAATSVLMGLRKPRRS